MPDDLERKRPEDPARININQRWEVEYWCGKLGCTEEELKDAVGKVGVSVRKVKNYLSLS